MTSVIAGILGVALVVWLAMLVRKAVTHQRELRRQKTEISSQRELEEFIRRVDQVTTDEELDHLDRKKEEH